MKNSVKSFWLNEEGAGMIEYALILALVGFAAYAGVKGIGSDLKTVYTGVDTNIKGQTIPAP